MVIKLSLLLLFVACTYAQLNVKWCIKDNEEAKCNDMKAAFQSNSLGTIQCIKGAHEAGCLRMIQDQEADIKSVTDIGIFAGGKFNNLVPILSEKRTGQDAESFFYKAVIAVKKSNQQIKTITDIKGKRSCHTGVMKTVGWVVPMGVLYTKAGMTLASDADACDNNIKSVAKFFSQSCAPGAYSPYNNPNANNPPNICERCDKTDCPDNDKYSGYVGAFNGLVDDRCDVAFIKHTTVSDAKNANSGIVENDYELLCPDNTRKPVDAWSKCNWAVRPTPAVVTRNDAAIQSYVTMLKNAVPLFGPTGTKKSDFDMFNSTKYLGQNLIFADLTKNFEEISTKTYQAHLGEGFLNSYEKFRPAACKKDFRWCVINDAEMKKCREFGAALGGRRITLDLSCVQSTNPDACMQLIKDGKADAVTVDGGHVYTGGKYFNLKPIMAEVYNTANEETSYYAVAVTTNKQGSLNSLQGKKTCHTGFERTSGWNVPIGYFAGRNDIKIDPKTCNTGIAAANFFGDMCVPGALEPEYNHGQKNPQKMCALCQEDCKYRGIYNGYTGAVRCLLEKGGDVAFVKHTTIDDILKNPPTWAAGRSKNDFVLLCRDGTTKPVDQYKTCNLARVPSHAVMTSNDRKNDQVSHFQIALDRAQLKYGKNATGAPLDSFFNLFKSVGGKDLLFKDSTMKLKKITSDYKAFLGKSYLDTASAMDSRKCYVGASSSIKFSFTATVIAVILSVMW